MHTCGPIRRRSSLSHFMLLSSLAAGLALNGAGCPNAGTVLSEVSTATGATRPGAIVPGDLDTDSADSQLDEAPAPAPAPTPTPALTAPAPITLNCGDPTAADVLDAFLTEPVAIAGSGAVRITSSTAAEPGVRTVTWTATDAATGDAVQVESSVTIVGDTTAPTLSLKGDANLTLNCDMQFTDPGVVVQDDCDVLIEPQVEGAVDPQTPGRYTITYTATDASANSATPLTRTVTVVAASEPELTVNEPVVLWPPNHRVVTFTLADLVTITGGCGDRTDANAMGSILFVYCDEPQGDSDHGRGEADIVISDGHTFSVVAERNGQGNGRVYGVQFEISNGSGDPVEYVAFIHVPHDQSGRDVIDDGAESGQMVRR